ncbi:integral membrane protein [Mycobacteroides abscessus subsp. abscessus]|nr:integral membrane protein [Mycobacteroides abscessus subsp. abscessus]
MAWYAAVGSHQLALGVPLAIVAVAALVLLFSPTAQMWAGGDEAGADESD